MARRDSGLRHVSTDAQDRIEHRLTRFYQPWTNGQVERMNRALEEAAVQRRHDGSQHALRDPLAQFLGAQNFARRLKTLKGLVPLRIQLTLMDRRAARVRRQSAL